MNHIQKIKSRFVLIGIILFAFILCITLYSRQIIKGETYAIKADKQYARPKAQVFDRGSIYFKSKDGIKIAAATIERGYVAFVNPKLMNDVEEVYSSVSQFLKIDKTTFLKIASKKDDPYEEIAHRLDQNTMQSLLSLSMPSVGVTVEAWRSYPGGVLSAHLLGLTGQSTSSSLIEGKYGIERSYQDTLDRSRESNSSIEIFAQLFVDVRDSLIGEKKIVGDIVTTIEPTVEAYLEKILNETNAIWHPDEIGGIIIDPKTGDIIAMASLPTFNPNDTSLINNASIFSNPLVEHVYEMGSIMKPLTIAMGLDSGAIDSDFIYDDPGCITLDTKKICNSDRLPRNLVNIQTVLDHSLNIGAATIAIKAGSEKVINYFSDRYNFGRKTGIDLPNEATNLLGNMRRGRDIEIATAAYGQGIAVSPIAMTRALSILANDGYSIVPHVVSEIIYSDGTSKDMEVEQVKIRSLNKTTVDEVTKILVSIVDKTLKGGAIKMPNHSIAAKTGTAQIPDPKNGGYYTDRYLHSFFGYFPAYNPKFLIFIYQVHPKGAQYASETLTDPFANMAKFLINYYNVPPDR